MPPVSLPDPIFPPLSSNRDLVNIIQHTSGESREVVIDRLIAEHECTCINLKQDFEKFNLTPYVFSEEMIEFYRTTQSYLYATAVWNRSRLKCDMRTWIAEFLVTHQLTSASVLTFGDGMGFDSTFLAKLGCSVTAFEPSEECRRFAQAGFAQNNVSVRHEQDAQQLQPATFDVIVCLDVLEHVPDPAQTVQEFANWLKPGGVLISHSPFYYIDPYQPTHLKSNQKYSGNAALFTGAGLIPYDGNWFWNPIVVQKSSSPATDRQVGKLRLGQPLLILGRCFPLFHNWVARWLSRVDPKWVQELRELKQSTEQTPQN